MDNNDYAYSFTYVEKIKDMKISLTDNKSISLQNILNLAEKYCKPIEQTLNDSNIKINIFYVDEEYICFNLCGKKIYDILRKPLKIKIFNKDLEIVCDQQLDYFLKKYYQNPKIYCSCGQITNIDIRYLINHKDHVFTIIDFDEIKPATELEVEMEVTHKKSQFLNETFASPQDFEKNFNYYFKLGEKNKNFLGSFHIFDDKKKNRFFISHQFLSQKNFGKKIDYFGASGKGKSITLLGAFKFMAPQKDIRTLYINCKCLKALLDQQQIKIFKKILIDEIAYLFYGDYKNYLNCFDQIKFFNFVKDRSFWPLIDLILKECSKLNRTYIIGFDQYDNSVDLNNNLSDLEEKYLNNNNDNNNNKFKFIVISSMNENDIRQKKMNLLFDKSSPQNVHELNDLCENPEINFNEDELIVFNKLGKTFKAFNEILFCSNNKELLKNYIEEKKKKYLFKMISFYNDDKEKKRKYNPNLSEENIMDISESKYKDFLSFQINHKYSRTEMEEKIVNVPFRYFNVRYTGNGYIVEPSFPLINEILDDIFRYIILNKDFEAFKSLANNQGNAYSSLFEYKVRYKFYPKIKGIINYFNNFDIEENISMDVFIPREKDRNDPKFIQKLEPAKAYLVEQKQFGGKDLDFLIIHNLKNPEVFGFQVSTYKEEIFTSLQNTYKALIFRLNISFDIKINENDVYFGYIFDYSRIGSPLYTSMLRNCRKNNMKYSFYNSTNDSLYLDQFKKTNNIFDIVGKPKIKIDNKKYQKQRVLDFWKYNPFYGLTGGQINTIINILKTEKKDNQISTLKYLRKESHIKKEDKYLSVVANSKENLIIFFFADNFLISKIITNEKNIENNNFYFSNNFHIYEIIKK